MSNLLNAILKWSEVWALLIPLTILITLRHRMKGMRIIIFYVFIALFLNMSATLISQFHKQLPADFRNNNLFYNLHSIFRVLLFGWFILNLKLFQSFWLPKIVLPVYFIFLLINFIFFENLMELSTPLFTAESIVLLVLSLFFFIKSMQDESEINWLKHPSFLVCTGIILYEALSFFIFLFFYPLFDKNPEFGLLTMKIFSFSYIILCILLALALRRSCKRLIT